jgi:hypothetical protein
MVQYTSEENIKKIQLIQNYAARVRDRSLFMAGVGAEEKMVG